jgi:hypothetical protein
MRWPFSRSLELAVKIDDEWAFQANGAPHLVIGAFNGWLAVINDSHDDAPEPKSRVVGFGKHDLETDTTIAD